MRVPPEYSTTAKYIIIATALFAILYFGGKGIIGLVIYSPTTDYTIQVGESFTKNDTYYAELKDLGVLKGLELEGSFTGSGRALVYLEIGNKSLLVLDTSSVRESNAKPNESIQASPLITGHAVEETTTAEQPTTATSTTSANEQPATPTTSQPETQQTSTTAVSEPPVESTTSTTDTETPTTETSTTTAPEQPLQEVPPVTSTTIEPEAQATNASNAPTNENPTGSSEPTNVSQPSETQSTIVNETKQAQSSGTPEPLVNETQQASPNETVNETANTNEPTSGNATAGGTGINATPVSNITSNATQAINKSANETLAASITQPKINESVSIANGSNISNTSALPGNVSGNASINQTVNVSMPVNASQGVAVNATKPSHEIPSLTLNQSISFTNACNETCSLNNNASTIKLVIRIIGDGQFYLSRIHYQFSKITQLIEPKLVKPIPDIIIEQNKSFSLILSDYFTGSNLSYTFEALEHINIRVRNGKAYFTPKSGFLGTESTSFYATNPKGVAQSNRFNIKVEVFKGKELLNRFISAFPYLSFIEVSEAGKLYTIVYEINNTVVRIKGLQNITSLSNISVGEVDKVNISI